MDGISLPQTSVSSCPLPKKKRPLNCNCTPSQGHLTTFGFMSEFSHRITRLGNPPSLRSTKKTGWGQDAPGSGEPSFSSVSGFVLHQRPGSVGRKRCFRASRVKTHTLCCVCLERALSPPSSYRVKRGGAGKAQTAALSPAHSLAFSAALLQGA